MTMRKITITHRGQGYGYLLSIEGVGETILMGADDLLFFTKWGIEHRQELEQEAQEEVDEDARNLLSYEGSNTEDVMTWDILKQALDSGKRFKVDTKRGGRVFKDRNMYRHDLPNGGGSAA